MLERIHWLGHASFRINGPPFVDDPVIYIDPWRIPDGAPSADLILISHEHHDHCSPDDIERIMNGSTQIIASQRVADRISFPVVILREWQATAIPDLRVSVRAVPAYTVNHTYHDRSYGGLGFIITIKRHDIYFAGDTDKIPEMAKIGCDIALVPVGGSYTMDVEAAVEAVELIKPKIAIPMHYGREIPGSRHNGMRFTQAVNGGISAVELEDERVASLSL